MGNIQPKGDKRNKGKIRPKGVKGDKAEWQILELDQRTDERRSRVSKHSKIHEP